LRKVNEAMIEVQFQVAGRLLAQGGQDSERALRQRGWKAYDAWVQLVNETVNSLYLTPDVGASLGRLMEESLRWPRFGSFMTSAFFAGLSPMGPSAVAELTELRAEVAGLHDELAMARVEAEETCVAQPADSQASAALSATRNGGMEARGPVRWRSEPRMN
jgi:hypothetical protein